VRIDVLTIFPDWFTGPLTVSLLGRAAGDGTLDVRVHDLRDWTTDRHRSVDDRPYGGGAGMVMRADVWVTAAEAVWNDLAPEATAGRTDPPDDARYLAGGDRPRTVVLTPRGVPFTQTLAREFAAVDRLVLCCGRYEGIDERAHELVATDEVSIGDYVLFGGEVAATAVIETVARLVPGVLGNATSPEDESFSPRPECETTSLRPECEATSLRPECEATSLRPECEATSLRPECEATSGLLEYPQYTRPAEVRGRGVPPVLTSGDHGAVDRWRRERAHELTRRRRPDLLDDPT
jgi:tRNA (guanine37-N1)-methyltransferase